MSLSILASLRKNNQLRGSLLLAAQELGHRADGRSGEVTISYSYLASKCHQSRRTAMRQIRRLLDLGIIARKRFWGTNNLWQINRYKFLIRWEQPTKRLNTGDTLPPKFPMQEKGEEREKFGSLADMQKAKKKVLSWLTPNSALWQLAR